MEDNETPITQQVDLSTARLNDDAIKKLRKRITFLYTILIALLGVLASLSIYVFLKLWS